MGYYFCRPAPSRYDKQTKESRGFGFVTYACAAASFVVRGNLFWFRN